MRVLMVAESFGGGVLETVRLICAGLVGAGHSAAIAYGRRPETPDDLRPHLDSRVDLFAMPWTERTLREQAATARRLRQLVRRWRPDVVHSHSSFAGVVSAISVPRAVPTIYSPHAYAFALRREWAFRALAFRTLERFVARRVSVVGAVSRSEAEMARTAARARSVVVIENGIAELDIDTAPKPVARGRPLVVSMGRTVPQRQPEQCARILSAISDLADVAWIGGGGGDRGSDGWAALTAEGIAPTGWLPREQVLERLADATAYLHWTATDGLPLSVLEAMARDVVVVASDIPPNRDVLGSRQVCSDEAAAVRLLREVLGDPTLAAELLAEQRRRGRHYSAARMVREWIELYRRLAETGAP